MVQQEEWVLAERQADDGLHVIRLRKLSPSFAFKRYAQRLSVTWTFQDTRADDTPTDAESEAMETFETTVRDHIERAGHAVLAIVFTEPGYRQFVYLAKEVEAFLEGLNDMPQPEEGYPIEIHHEEDIEGDFYRSYSRKLIK